MTSSSSEKFQRLLRELFQFDCADLDFGIYRIMNHKRGVIEKFIAEDLPRTIADELQRGPLADQAQAVERLQELARQIHDVLGGNALDADGNLAVMYRDTPLGRKFLRAKRTGGLSREALEATIYNHLYAFFSRYYQDGDFISKRRYSRRQPYAIPYNGEEVYLHWANNDQYYVKSDEHFRNYAFTRQGVTVRFTVRNASVEQNDVKGDKRFFLPQVAEITCDAEAGRVLIPFEYRPLTGREELVYGRRNQQEAIIRSALTEVPRRLRGADAAVAALTAERHRNGDGRPVDFLEYHLRRYTRRNTSDFFIHKNLQGFLTRELDFYLKNEVLDLDELAAIGEEVAEGWFQLMRTIKAVGGRIIEFLDQIESFQKMLWEKRKFITETQYCITIGTIDRKFYPDIAACDSQWAEWKDLFHLDEDEDNLFSFNCNGDRTDRRLTFLETNPTLVLDTRHFDSGFVDRLLNDMDHVDDRTDGLLIHSENFQALGLLHESYRNRVECVYLDPPYNTGDSEILYKNEYLFSSWLTMMENRLSLMMGLLKADPVLFIAIDDFEMADLCELIDKHYPFFRREMIVVNHHPQGGKATLLANTHEYMLSCVSKGSGRTLVGRITKDDDELRPFKRSGTAASNFRYARPNSFYSILVDAETRTVVGAEPPPARNNDEYPRDNTEEGYVRVYPFGTQGEERVWRRSYESCLPLIRDGKLQCSNGMTIYHRIEVQDRSAALFSNWVDPRYNAGTFGANLLGDIIGVHNSFSYPKSVHTVGDAIFGAGIEDDSCCVDFFAGSGTTGHAVIDLNREDGGDRKFVLVEMGRHFDTVLMPRIKKVTFTPEWKAGKPKRAATPEEVERGPRIVKYHRLESYEDALNNIAFDDAAGQQALRFDDYLLKYLLTWETRTSATLLNVEKLNRPFDYRLDVHADGRRHERLADLPETFNYLLGLRVQTRRVHHDEGRRYLVYRGSVEDRTTVVIWRETEGWRKEELIRDKEFVTERELTAGADAVFVNGDSFIPNAKALEPVFKARMFAPLEN